MNLDWTNLVSVDSIQPGHSLSNVGLGVQCILPNTVIALPFFNLEEQNELRLDKFGISRLHSTWTFTI